MLDNLLDLGQERITLFEKRSATLCSAITIQFIPEDDLCHRTGNRVGDPPAVPR